MNLVTPMNQSNLPDLIENSTTLIECKYEF
jgi:hypothetical protein